MKTMLENAVAGILPTDEEALALADYTDTVSYTHLTLPTKQPV